MIVRLEPRIRDYAWGSRTALAELAGRPSPTESPEAEMWMGAHEASPCVVGHHDDRTTLDKLIAADPIGMLGETTVTQFQRRLPFLLKLLAPEQALSIQAHPSREEALTAPTGTYVDNWPKPEAWLTVTEFEMFAGTLAFDEIRSAAGELQCQRFGELIEAAAGSGVKQLLRSILQAEESVQRELTEEVVRASGDRRDHPHYEAIHRIAAQFPGDVGAAVLLTMRHHVVPANSYVFLPAGVLHAAVHGVTVEILANSDNVVRAGLTPKRIDITELLRIVDVHRPVVVEEPPSGVRVHSFPVDVPYFQLHQVNPGTQPEEAPGRNKPRIVLCIGGTITLDDGVEQIELGPAQSCFVPASVDHLHCSGDGTAYVATTGLVG